MVKITGTNGINYFLPTAKELMVACATGDGFCVGCGAEAARVEPDACAYPCEACGFNRVYGAEECVLRGWVR